MPRESAISGFSNPSGSASAPAPFRMPDKRIDDAFCHAGPRGISKAEQPELFRATHAVISDMTASGSLRGACKYTGGGARCSSPLLTSPRRPPRSRRERRPRCIGPRLHPHPLEPFAPRRGDALPRPVLQRGAPALALSQPRASDPAITAGHEGPVSRGARRRQFRSDHLHLGPRSSLDLQPSQHIVSRLRCVTTRRTRTARASSELTTTTVGPSSPTPTRTRAHAGSSSTRRPRNSPEPSWPSCRGYCCPKVDEDECDLASCLSSVSPNANKKEVAQLAAR